MFINKIKQRSPTLATAVTILNKRPTGPRLHEFSKSLSRDYAYRLALATTLCLLALATALCLLPSRSRAHSQFSSNPSNVTPSIAVIHFYHKLVLLKFISNSILYFEPRSQDSICSPPLPPPKVTIFINYFLSPKIKIMNKKT